MISRRTLLAAAAGMLAPVSAAATGVRVITLTPEFEIFSLPSGSQPERMAIEPVTKTVWFTARGLGAVGRLDPENGEVSLITLGSGARPRGLVADRAGRLYALDGALNAVHQVDMVTGDVRRFDLRAAAGYVQLMHATIDQRDHIWFTGYRGVYGRLDPATGDIRMFDASSGRGPHGIAAGLDGRIWIASFASDTILAVNAETGMHEARTLPRHLNGPKGIAVGAAGAVWVSCARGGSIGRFEPRTRQWSSYRLADADMRPYAIALDDANRLWVADETQPKLLRIDLANGGTEELTLPMTRPTMRHVLMDESALWCAASGSDKLVWIKAG